MNITHESTIITMHYIKIDLVKSMQLPDDVLAFIREYSKPLTRPDWRSCCLLSNHQLYICLNVELCKHKPLMNQFNTLFLYKRVLTHLKNTQWGRIYMMTRSFGIDYASCYFKQPPLHNWNY